VLFRVFVIVRSSVVRYRRPTSSLGVAARLETFARGVSPVWVLRTRFAVAFARLCGLPPRVPSGDCSISRIEPRVEFRSPSEFYPHDPSSSPQAQTPLLRFRALQHLQQAESLFDERCRLVGSAFRV
jgi:hypothetical protein